MSFYLRVILLLIATLTFLFVCRKLRKSQLQIMDVCFWISFVFVLLVLGIFPNIGIFFAEMLGIMSAANFIFLVVIFLLILRCFLLTIRVSQLEMKMANLVEEIAVRKRQEIEESTDESIG